MSRRDWQSWIVGVVPGSAIRRPRRRHSTFGYARRLFAPAIEALERRTLLSAVPTSITVGASANSAVYGQAVNLTANVSASPTAPSEGNVAFFDNGTLLATQPVTSGVATLDNVDLPAGTDVVTASYSDASGNFASSSTSVNPQSTIETVAGGALQNDLPAIDASISLQAVALDSSGDKFIADNTLNVVFEVSQATGVITIVAGSGAAGFSGDGGPATAAELNDPEGVAVDSSGDLFIADRGNNRIREVDHATGIITTVAGNGTSGFSGDGGPATAAEIRPTQGVAVDSLGDLFIADNNNERLREVDHATGIITTVAGNGNFGFSGDGGSATAAELGLSSGIVVDSSGDLFFTDSNRIREVDHATGVISTVAGNGTGGFSGDGGPATAAELNGPESVAVDSSGDLFIADSNNERIRELDHAMGVITTVAGNGAFGFSGDGGAATAAEFRDPTSVAVNSSGDIFIADALNDRIREVDLATGVVTTATGNGTRAFSGDGGPATAAEVDSPQYIATDSSGDLFIADHWNNRIREVNHATGVISTVAGNGTRASGGFGGLGGDGGPATAAELNGPGGIALDSSGDLFIADSGNNRVREVNLATGIITTVAGDGAFGFSGDGGPATAAELSYPSGVAVDSSGNLFITDWGDDRIREVNHATGIIATVAGNGRGGFSGDGGPATAAEFFAIEDIAVDSSGDLIIADSGNDRIREVNPTTGVIKTVAGNGIQGFTGDGGPATAASLLSPDSIAVDSSDNLFIADRGNNRVRKVDLATGLITTIAGSGTAGISGDGGPATAAEIGFAEGIAVDSSGDLFIADQTSNRIREVASGAAVVNVASASVTPAPTSITVSASANSAVYGQAVTLTANVSASPSSPSEGNVAFYDNGTLLGTQPVSSGVATLDNVYLPAGTDLVTASYSDASHNFASSSTAVGPNSTIETVAGGALQSDLPAVDASVSPRAAAVDSSGNLFIADDTLNAVFEVHHATGVVTTVAGNGTRGFTGDGGPATAAELNDPQAVAVDSSGHLFVADANNSRIREVDLATDVITTVAGNGTGAFSGDGRLATAAGIGGPSGVAVDSSGDLFIDGDGRIREVDHTSGIITSVAGNGVLGFSGDGGPATAAELSFAAGIAVDSSGDLFIADSGNSRVREVNHATGVISTVAGNGAYGFSGDGGPATSAELSGPAGIAVDSSDDLFIADTSNNRIREVNLATGVITTIAGNGSYAFNGDGGSATSAELREPAGVAVDSSGDLIIADTYNYRIREVDHATGVITTVAGNGTRAFSGDGGPATLAEVDSPQNIAVDSSGDLFIADGSNDRVREVNHATGVITTIAGNGPGNFGSFGGFGGDGGPATAAYFSNPQGLAVDSSGDLFIADSTNFRVREVNHATGVITTVAGNGTRGFTGDGGPATAAELGYLEGIAIDSSGDLFIADWLHNRIREVNHATGNITTVAGNGTSGFSGDGGPATAAELSSPEDIAVDSSGDLFIADNDRVREVDHATGIITAVAGNGTGGFSGDGGQATAAELGAPAGIWVDSSGDLFIVDAFNGRIREVDHATGVITTVAGNGTQGFSGDGGPASAAEFSLAGGPGGVPFLDGPEGVAVDSSGDLFIADHSNNRIREVASGAVVNVTPAPLTITADDKSKVYGAALPTLTASYSGFVNGDTPASLTTQPTLSTTAIASSPVSGSPYAITASGAADPNYTISYVAGTLTVTPAPTSITISTSANSVVYGQAVKLMAKVSASPSTPSEGDVAFYDNGTLLARQPVTSGVATLDNAELPAGKEIITASYSDASGNFVPSSTDVNPQSTIETIAGGALQNGLPAIDASISPQAVAVDSSGNLFIADDTLNVVFEVNHATGVISTVAGNGTPGFSGDGGPATAAQLANPEGVAVDSSGHLFIADTYNNRIREVDLATGVITTVVGHGTPGFNGDGGPATAAELSYPQGVAVDSAGDLFIADNSNNRIREVDLATALITTLAGNGTAGFSGDGGPATAAELYSPDSVAVDSSGHLFIADTYNERIREVDLARGAITTVAGTGTLGLSGDGGPATAAELFSPQSVAVDASGDVFLVDDNLIREVNHATGVITTVAGHLALAFSGDGGAAAAANLNMAVGVAVDSSGDVFIADNGNDRVREVNQATGIIATVAGNGTRAFSGDGGQATAAEVDSPENIAFDTSGDLFIADASNNRIREVNRTTRVVTTVAGNGTRNVGGFGGSGGFGGDGGPATEAELDNPQGIAVDSSGHLFVADTYNNRIREVNLATGIITTIAGNGTGGFGGDGGPATAAELSYPRAVAVDSSGDLFFTDTINNRIREVNLATGIITTVAGNGTSGSRGDGGPATAAELDNPEGLAVDSSGDLFIADGFSNRVRKVNLATGIITTVAGKGLTGLNGDGGPATAAELHFPTGISFDSSGDMFIADTGNNRVRELNLATGIITTLAGNGTAGFSGDGGPADAAELSVPLGVGVDPSGDLAVDSSGNLFIADIGNNRIREVATGAVVNVMPAQLTITALDETKVYGAALPTLTASYSGFVNGDTAASLATQPTLSTTATADSHVSGSPYTITASGAVDPDYTISYMAGALTVTPATLTVTANDASKIQGAPNPVFTDTISGFVNGDTSSVVSGAANLSTTATTTSPVGSYPITVTAGTLSAADYNFAFQNGTLRVTPPTPFVANDAVYTIGSGTVSVSAAAGLLTNDTGPSQLTVTAGTVTGAQGGTFVFNADGSFTYTPAANFPGYDSAPFTVSDASGDKATQTVTVLSQHASVVWKFYESVLNRTPDPAGLAYWTNYFNGGGQTGDMAVGFFESDELLDKIITNYYQQYLLRTPDASGTSFWVGEWQATGEPEGIKAGFADSPEFYKSAGGTPSSWLTALYERILSRTPDPAGFQFWLNYYQQQTAAGADAGTVEQQIALGFFESAEAYGDDVTGWFNEYLGRNPTASEQSQYASQMEGGATDRMIEQEITNLPEYASNPPAPPASTAAPLANYYQTPASSGSSQAVVAAKDAVFSRL